MRINMLVLIYPWKPTLLALLVCFVMSSFVFTLGMCNSKGVCWNKERKNTRAMIMKHITLAYPIFRFYCRYTFGVAGFGKRSLRVLSLAYLLVVGRKSCKHSPKSYDFWLEYPSFSMTSAYFQLDKKPRRGKEIGEKTNATQNNHSLISYLNWIRFVL